MKDGLVNGAMGTIRHFTKTTAGEIHIIWIEFDNSNVGKDLRQHHQGLYRNNATIGKTWTPIFALCRHFQTGAMGKGRKLYEINRIQFGLEIAHARSLTKIQGMSLNFRHYIDFKDLRMHGGKLVHHATANAFVVGVSRATDPKHLKILGGFDERLMKRSILADNEIDRLRSDPKCQFEVSDLKKLEGFKVVFYNLQGLRSGMKLKAKQLTKDTNLMEADLLLGCETNLNKDSQHELYDLPGFYSKNFYGKLNQIGRGLIIYSKEESHLQNTEAIMKDHVEYSRIAMTIEQHSLVIIFLYRSEKYPLRQFRNDLDMLVTENEKEKNVIILGDWNNEDRLIDSSYEQLIQEPTTRDRTTIDQAYVKLEHFKVQGLVLYKSFVESTHHPICLNIISTK